MKTSREADDICDTRTVCGNFKGKSLHAHTSTLRVLRVKLDLFSSRLHNYLELNAFSFGGMPNCHDTVGMTFKNLNDIFRGNPIVSQGQRNSFSID